MPHELPSFQSFTLSTNQVEELRDLLRICRECLAVTNAIVAGITRTASPNDLSEEQILGLDRGYHYLSVRTFELMEQVQEFMALTEKGPPVGLEHRKRA